MNRRFERLPLGASATRRGACSNGLADLPRFRRWRHLLGCVPPPPPARSGRGCT